jgi:acyl-CoA thioesterase-1
MFKSKTIQTLLNRAIYKGWNILNFCYLIVVLSLISCGNGSTTVSEESTNSVSDTATETPESSSKKTILFFGDSITAGYGLDDMNDAYPSVIQSRIDSLGLDYEVINSGLSGETSAGGKSRVEWILNQNIDVFVLELGANDGLRGTPLAETRANLQAIINAVQTNSTDTKIILAGMQLPPNMGETYTSGFRSIFSDLAVKNDLAFIPFILEDVGGVASLNQSDGIHPTVEGHKIVANNVWAVLSAVINP